MTILPGQTATLIDLSAISKNKEKLRSSFPDPFVMIGTLSLLSLLRTRISVFGLGEVVVVVAVVVVKATTTGGRCRADVFWTWAPIWTAGLAWASIQIFFRIVRLG